ncbi:hypothetical protein D9M68_707630 [compost metagenome]
MAKVVQIEVTESQATPVALGQARGKQGLETLAIGNAGQRILFGQAMQGFFQAALLAYIAQAAAQHIGRQAVAHQPVAHTDRRLGGLFFKQQDGWQGAAPGCGLARCGSQQQAVVVVIEEAAGSLPGGRGNQRESATQSAQALAQ